MKNVKRVLRRVGEWLEPFLHSRATYGTHLRVRVTRWLAWGLHVCAVAMFGFAVTMAAIMAMIFEMDYHSVPTADYLIGLLASRACLQTNTACVPEAMYGVVVAVGVLACMISLMVFGFAGTDSPRPAPVTNSELEEYRMLGYIVMEVEDYEDDINGRVAVALADRRDIGGVPEPGQLDQAGLAGGRAQPEGEGADQLAGAY